MFLHTFQPDSILLDLGFVQVHWYGFLITLGAVLGFFVFYKLVGTGRRPVLDKNKIFDLIFWLGIWSIIGGRIYHVLSEINYYIQNPLEIFYIWNGGLGIYGVVIAGVLVVWFFAKKNSTQIKLIKLIKTDKKNKSLFLLDLLVPGLALAQTIGRWGNYFNQELYGQPTNLPWAIPISLSNRLPGYENFEFFHPVFLYESIFCLILFVILLFCCRNAPWRVLEKETNSESRENTPRRVPTVGYMFLLYIFLYSLWRFFIEFLRIDYQPVFLNLRLGQWTSLVLVILSVIFYIILLRKIKIAHRLN